MPLCFLIVPVCICRGFKLPDVDNQVRTIPNMMLLDLLHVPLISVFFLSILCRGTNHFSQTDVFFIQPRLLSVLPSALDPAAAHHVNLDLCHAFLKRFLLLGVRTALLLLLVMAPFAVNGQVLNKIRWFYNSLCKVHHWWQVVHGSLVVCRLFLLMSRSIFRVTVSFKV